MNDHTREQWLNECAAAMAPWFTALGHSLPTYRVSIGFTSKGARSNRIGECWSDSCSGDAHHEIFIHPSIADSSRVADILAHELVHAAVGLAAKHGPKFRKVALALGLEGKMTATKAGPKFLAAIAPILEKLGPIPHAALSAGNSSSPKKQPTRMLKCTCPECGYTVRTTAKWLEHGAPVCPVDEIAMPADEGE